MKHSALADRLITYSDTIVAFALVNGFAFLIALGDPDTRCSIANVPTIAITMNALFPIVGTWALVWLRRYEHKLRAAAEEDDLESLVERFWSVLFRVRLVLIWLFSIVVILGIYGATRDTSCVTAAGLAP